MRFTPAVVVCFGLVALHGPAVAAAPPGSRPNVLLICVDDLKPLLGCYGTTTVKSPNIDRLAARGVLFQRAFCNQAVCAPSRNSLMTGLRPPTLGIYELSTFFRESVPNAVTLAEYFKQQGYRTEAMGKIYHVGHGNHDDPQSWSVPHWTPKGGGYVLKETAAEGQKRGAEAKAAGVPAAKMASLPKGVATECADVPDEAYGDGMIAAEAIGRIQAAKDRPGESFFIAVGFLKPHRPFVAPKKYWDLYRPTDFKLPSIQVPPEGAPEFAPTTWGELRNYSDIPKTGPLTDEQKLHLIHGYHAATSFMDAQLGRVLDALDASGLASNTIILFWGDHGWHLGDHGMWCKHTNYEHAARIPLIVAASGQCKPGSRCGSVVETVDIYPTLCELAGLAVPAGLEGRSFAAAVKDAASPTKPYVYHVYPRSTKELGPILGRAVRTERYRLVEWKKIGAAPDTAILELYDYEKDPDETRNLAAEQPQVVAQLRTMLAQQPEAKPQIRTGAGRSGAKPSKGKGKKSGGARAPQGT